MTELNDLKEAVHNLYLDKVISANYNVALDHVLDALNRVAEIIEQQEKRIVELESAVKGDTNAP